MVKIAQLPSRQRLRRELLRLSLFLFPITLYTMSPYLMIYTPLEQEDGAHIDNARTLQSLKGYTARQANRILQREGAFRQAESYDRVVRDAAELERIVVYVLNNPVKAGLVSEWQH